MRVAKTGELFGRRAIENVVDKRRIGSEIRRVGVRAVRQLLRERIRPRCGQPAREPLSPFHLQGVVPGIAERRSKEWRNPRPPLRMRPKRLLEKLRRWETRVDAIRILQSREALD